MKDIEHLLVLDPSMSLTRNDAQTVREAMSLTAPAAEFGAAIEAHRRDIILLCYRFMGSIADAEEAAQETALRAWRGRETFRGEASVRTWLHRIAVRVCLDLLRGRKARPLPQDVQAASTAGGSAPEPAATEIPWLEPIPNALVAGVDHDPAARYALRESVSLAFIAALQSLPARQRAVLLLRDVLAWSARETADALGIRLGAANSLLHRARRSLQATHHRSGSEAVVSRPPDDPTARRLLAAYLRAWESDDVPGLLATMREDVRLAMPPSPSWYAGRDAVGAMLRSWVFGPLRPTSGYRLRRSEANGAAAFVFGAAGGDVARLGVQVLDIDDDRIRGITVFVDAALAARFEEARQRR